MKKYLYFLIVLLLFSISFNILASEGNLNGHSPFRVGISTIKSFDIQDDISVDGFSVLGMTGEGIGNYIALSGNSFKLFIKFYY